jgi:hypothetical protein
MLRTALVLSSLFAAACTVGDLPTNRGNGQVDAGNGSGSNPQIDAAPTGNGCVDRVTAGDPHIHGTAAGGGTHAGDDCMTCHAKGAAGPAPGPQFQFGGTLYKADGVTPNAGVTIRIKPAGGGTPVPLVTDTAGNFSAAAGTIPAAFPATVDVTVCPTVTAMGGQLVANGGGACNSGGCHAKGGTQGVIRVSP